MANEVVAVIAWPEGKEKAGAWATGSVKEGLARSTTVLTSSPISPPATAVTPDQAVSRQARR